HAVRGAVDLHARRETACRGRGDPRGSAPDSGAGGGVMIVRAHLVAVAAALTAATASAQTSEVRGTAEGGAKTEVRTKADTTNAPSLTLTIDEAVRRAVEHNPDLAIVRLATEVEAAHVTESRSAYTPVLSSTLGRSSIVT